MVEHAKPKKSGRNGHAQEIQKHVASNGQRKSNSRAGSQPGGATGHLSARSLHPDPIPPFKDEPRHKLFLETRMVLAMVCAGEREVNGRSTLRRPQALEFRSQIRRYWMHVNSIVAGDGMPLAPEKLAKAICTKPREKVASFIESIGSRDQQQGAQHALCYLYTAARDLKMVKQLPEKLCYHPELLKPAKNPESQQGRLEQHALPTMRPDISMLNQFEMARDAFITELIRTGKANLQAILNLKLEDLTVTRSGIALRTVHNDVALTGPLLESAQAYYDSITTRKLQPIGDMEPDAPLFRCRDGERLSQPEGNDDHSLYFYVYRDQLVSALICHENMSFAELRRLAGDFVDLDYITGDDGLKLELSLGPEDAKIRSTFPQHYPALFEHYMRRRGSMVRNNSKYEVQPTDPLICDTFGKPLVRDDWPNFAPNDKRK